MFAYVAWKESYNFFEKFFVEKIELVVINK